MNYFGRIISNLSQVYSEINPATLTGAIDVIVVEQEDGTYSCSPFHVRFGKIGVLRSREKIVDIEINGEPVDIHMKLGDSGEAYFVEEANTDDEENRTDEDDEENESPNTSAQSSDLNNSKESSDKENNCNSRTSAISALSTSEAAIFTHHDVDDDHDHVMDHQLQLKRANVPQTLTENSASQDKKCDTVASLPITLAGVGDGDTSQSNNTIATTHNNNNNNNNNVQEENHDESRVLKRVKRKKKSARSKLSSNRNSESNLQSLVPPLFAPPGGVKGQSDYYNHHSQQHPQQQQQSHQSHQHSKHPKSLQTFTNDDELHPFSDSEISHLSAKYSRQECIAQDCKSDSEYEMYKANCKNSENGCSNHHHDNQDTISWDWGELPQNVDKNPQQHSSSQPDEHSSGQSSSAVNSGQNDAKQQEHSPNSKSFGMFGLFKSNQQKPSSHTLNDEDKGIYLDALDPNEINPEVAAKYFPNISTHSSSRDFMSKKFTDDYDEDVESGKGASLSASPHSDFNFNPSLSSNSQDNDEIFGFDKDCIDLSFLAKKYHDLSMSLCGRIDELQCSNDSRVFLQSLIGYDDFVQSPEQILNNPNLVIRFGGKYYSWKMASAMIMSVLVFQRPLPDTSLEMLKPPKKSAAPASPPSGGWTSWFRSNQKDRQTATSGPEQGHSTQYSKKLELKAQDSPRLGKKPKSLDYTSDDDTINILIPGKKNETEPSSGAAGSSSTTAGQQDGAKKNSTSGEEKNKKVKFRKVLRLKSDVIKNLNLKPNSNDVMFSVTTAFQGTTVCRSKIFLWRYNDRIIISDIDGTITKSDVLGHVLPYFGKDWAQSGVTQLYSNIETNGYKFLYLSARAIGQAKTTRDYLRDLKQENISLPDGPLLLSPTSLFSALHREVIEKKPEEFKISCLKDIQTLFPRNPFFAGFGNKVNDNWAYNAVGIDMNRIFTINPKGELKLERLMSFKSSYSDLSQFADQMFPPTEGGLSPVSDDNTDFSDFMFWRSEIIEPSEADIRKISKST